MLVGSGLALAAVLTALGWLAHWLPTFDILNNGLPFLVVGTVALLLLARLLRDWRLVLPAIVLAAINIGFFVAGLQGAARTRQRALLARRYLLGLERAHGRRRQISSRQRRRRGGAARGLMRALRRAQAGAPDSLSIRCRRDGARST
jgi:hypothetical protein